MGSLMTVQVPLCCKHFLGTYYRYCLRLLSYRKQLIKNHIVPDVICCAGIVKSEWPFTRTISTISKSQLTLTRDRRPKVQNAAITKCDQIANNGVLHEINDVINVLPRQPTNNFYNTFFNRPFFFK